MAVKVEQVTQAKSGKSLRVMLSGTWYGAYLDSGLNGQVGKMIEAEITTLEKGGPWIKKWVASGAAPQVSPPPTSGLATASPAAAAPYDERNPPPQVYEREPQYA